MLEAAFISSNFNTSQNHKYTGSSAKIIKGLEILT